MILSVNVLLSDGKGATGMGDCVEEGCVDAHDDFFAADCRYFQLNDIVRLCTCPFI
jgi:hypothetical protein